MPCCILAATGRPSMRCEFLSLRREKVPDETETNAEIVSRHEEAVARQRRVVRRLSAIGANTTPARAVLQHLEEALAAVLRRSN
jgi:hypothetical protein